MKTFLGFVCVLIFCGFVWATEIPDKMLINPPAEVEAKMAPATFDHETHAFGCNDCHHVSEGNIQSCMSAGCHDVIDSTDRTNPLYFYNAFHDRKSELSCVGCHGSLKKAGEDTGPIACKECHAE